MRVDQFVQRFAAFVLAGALLGACAGASAQPRAHNAIIFVADGLRYGSVNDTDAPALAALRREGVDFANSHSIYPTLTTVNASAIATGHYVGDTGNYANTIYPGEELLDPQSRNRAISLENNANLDRMNARFAPTYLHEVSLLAAARAHGFNTAVIGKIGPAAIQDLGEGGLVIDQSIGQTNGRTLPADIAAAIAAAGLPPAPPDESPPNTAQDDWFVRVATEVLLPRFRASGKPFVILFWSPDPDEVQHRQQDSLDALTPGVNGPSSRAAIANASNDLARLRAALTAQHLDATTNIFATADHGFSTVWKETHSSYSATLTFPNYPAGHLPPAFLAIDLAHAFEFSLFRNNGAAFDLAALPRSGSALIGPDADHPRIIVAANGATDLLYLPGDDARTLAPRVVEFLTQQDYVAAIFVADSLGRIPGALPMSEINLTGSAATPQPAIVVSFRSRLEGCDTELCSIEIVDSTYHQGGGQHGGWSRGDTRNFMAAIGPDFRAGFTDPAPVSNADIAPTIAHALGFELPSNGRLRGRVIAEALPGGALPAFEAEIIRSEPAANRFQTILNRQHVGDTRYFDAAGAPGRTVGLREH